MVGARANVHKCTWTWQPLFCASYRGFSCLTEGVCNHRPPDENYHRAQSQPVILLQITGGRVAALGNLRQTDLGYLAHKPDKIKDVDCNNGTFEKLAPRPGAALFG